MNADEQVATARAEIARRRELARGTVQGPWASFFGRVRSGEVDLLLGTKSCGYGGSSHVAANDPTHVLGVLADADAILDRHAPRTDNPWDGCDWCSTSEFPVPSPCPDALVVIRRYPPQP